MERFFQIFAVADEIEVYDILYHRYGCIPDIGFAPLCSLIKKAKEENKKERIYRAWLAHIPAMENGSIPAQEFQEYYEHVTGKDIDTRPEEEILAEVREIRKEMGIE